jgi:hypothetical protein
MPKKAKANPELLAARIQIEQLTQQVKALREALEANQAPAPVLERAVIVESGLQKLWRIMGGG